MRKLFVLDTNSLISYHHVLFNVRNRLTNGTTEIIREAIEAYSSDIRLSIPSIVFVEIFEKWFHVDEFAKRFYYEVYLPIKESNNIEIKPVDKEILEQIVTISGALSSHDIHDKIILASAISLECPLISYDSKIVQYINQNPIIKVFS